MKAKMTLTTKNVKIVGHLNGTKLGQLLTSSSLTPMLVFWVH